MLKDLGIKAKLAILVTGAIIVVLIAATSICFLNFQKELKRIAQANQETRIQVFWDLLRQKGAEFRIEGDRLMIGDYVINGNHELPDKVQEICGGTATVFMHDERVATNVRKGDKTRAVGTTLKGVAYDTVSREHRTRDVDSATQEVATGGQGLSQATQEQAAAIEQVAATIEEMTASIKNNALNADKGREMALTMVNMASTSGNASQRLMEAMDEISVASRRVGDIITTANEVAFQTNLLALNAAVEAARAGEHGEEFAVVAEEVRALARRSAEAANEIKGLIEDTVQKVNAGDEIVRNSVESLNQIIANINDLSRNMDEIAAA